MSHIITIRRHACLLPSRESFLEYVIHLPPRTSIAIEKAAQESETDVEDLIIEAIEIWLHDNE